MAVFYNILGNNLVANVTNFTVWFAITFWVFIETQSVFATGMIAGIYLIMTASSGIPFGGIVDHNSKRLVMLGSSLVSFVLYAIAFAVHQAAPGGAMQDVGSVWLWAFILVVMLGVIAGNIRSIALPTLVTLMIPEDRRDRANGLVGMVSGIGFLTTSVISGFLVAWGGMFYTLIFAMGLTALAFLHLLFLKVDESAAANAGGAEEKPAEA
ncbi:MAG TPA: MFS transporter, partial [Devosia sp.]|nr:MFS transporter [Devosia sp.]